MDAQETAHVVREFWRLMGTNDFAAVSTVLADGFVLEWPQSRELIRGAANFARLNQDYPGGPWEFHINRIVVDEGEAVTDVAVSDGSQVARAISFFSLAGGKITRVVEFWPSAYEPPYDRGHLTGTLD
jgi:ketosteroid isomerase-like protein